MNEDAIDFESAIPLYYQLGELIKQKIYHNSWKANQMILSEAKLSAMYNVSVGTVKKTIHNLVNDGILYRKQGKGTFVARPNFDRGFKRFFRFAAEDEGERIVSNLHDISLENTIPTKKVRNILRLNNKGRVIFIRRVRIVKNVPHFLEDIYLPYELFPGIEEKDTTEKILYPIFEDKYNMPVIWADEFLKPKRVTAEQAQYLEIRQGAPVISIERIAYTYGDKPIEFRSAIARGDRFGYHVKIRFKP